MKIQELKDSILDEVQKPSPSPDVVGKLIDDYRLELSKGLLDEIRICEEQSELEKLHQVETLGDSKYIHAYSYGWLRSAIRTFAERL